VGDTSTMESGGRGWKRPDVSVVIPVYNAHATLPACLRGLEAQTLSRNQYEIIVVDNNSRDGSAAIASGMPQVTLLEERRQGAYAARNRGLRAARGSVIAFTDPDCVPAPDWLEAARSSLADGAVIAIGETIPAGRSRSLALLRIALRARDEYAFGGSDPMLYYGRTNNMAVQRMVFDEVGPFVERPRGADVLLVRSALRRFAADAIRFEPRMQVWHVELQGLGQYLRKMHVYGYAHHAYRRAAPVRSLRLSERGRLLRETLRLARSPAALPALVLLTAAAQASWRLGRWRAAARLRPPRGAGS
jgi:glycosyltransferase involved in cell wall biosynthesis